jgi:hypothetical protein
MDYNNLQKRLYGIMYIHCLEEAKAGAASSFSGRGGAGEAGHPH